MKPGRVNCLTEDKARKSELLDPEDETRKSELLDPEDEARKSGLLDSEDEAKKSGLPTCKFEDEASVIIQTVGIFLPVHTT
jgi:hypothetical protein